MAQQLAQSGDPTAIRKQLTAQIAGMGGFNKLLDDAQKQTQLQISQRELANPTPAIAQGQYRAILQKIVSGQSLTPEETAQAKAYEASESKNTTQSDSLGVTSTNTSRPAGLSTMSRLPRATMGGGPVASGSAPASAGASAGTPALTPSQVKGNIVDEIGQYKADPTLFSRLMIKHPEIIGMVQQKYPDWDQTSYQAKNSIVKSYTSGPESRSINAIGTALGHANELRDAIDALGNGNGGIQSLRALGNKIGVEVGDDPVTGFNLIVHRLAPEITAAYVQGGGGEGERTASANDFSPSMSRNQLIKNWSETVKLLQSKVAQQQQQWNTTYQPTRPQDQFATRFFSAPAKQAMARWASETGNSSVLGGGATSAPANDPFAQFGGKAHP
jgi:hypothetical protein